MTGAAQGIGAAIATCFASEGASVVVDYVGAADEADALVHQLSDEGHRAIAVQAECRNATR